MAALKMLLVLTIALGAACASAHRTISSNSQILQPKEVNNVIFEKAPKLLPAIKNASKHDEEGEHSGFDNGNLEDLHDPLGSAVFQTEGSGFGGMSKSYPISNDSFYDDEYDYESAGPDFVTVDDIFNKTGPIMEYAKHNFEGMKNDIIERWLNESLDVSPAVSQVEDNNNSTARLQKNDIITTTIKAYIDKESNMQGNNFILHNETTKSELAESLTYETSTPLSPSSTTVKATSQESKPVTSGGNQSIGEVPSFYYSSVCDFNNTFCVSLNLTVKIYVNNTQLYLPKSVAVDSDWEADRLNITMTWRRLDKIYDVSVIFGVRLQNGSCWVDAVGLKIRNRRNGAHEAKTKGEATILKEDLHLFEIGLGTSLEDAYGASLTMASGVEVLLSNVHFSSFKDEIKNSAAVKSCLLNEYLTELLIGGIVGGLLLVVVASVVFIRCRKDQDQFKPSTA